MTALNRPSAAAIAHARALLELADARGQTEQVAGEVKGIGDAVAESKGLRVFLTSPNVKDAERTDFIARTIAPRVSPLTKALLDMLASKRKLGLLAEIGQAMELLLDERLGKVEVDVTVARHLNASELEQVRMSVSSALKKDAVIHQYVDESIIGGIIVKVGDQLIDGSVKGQLDAVKRKMLGTR
jgi:F-type H+-transporting ATPase subunit delta